jgi:hypothetical protein
MSPGGYRIPGHADGATRAGLCCLNLSFCTGITMRGLAHLRQRGSLTALDVSHTNIEVEHLSWLGDLHGIR